MGIEVRSVSKSFGQPPTRVLHDLTFKIEAGEFVALTGRSGSGKSTLLYLLGALDFPTQGQIIVDGKDIVATPSRELHALRNLSMGFVFQSHYLLPELTALENVLMPSRKAKSTGLDVKPFEERATYLLEEFGIKNKSSRLPREMSGGEQQRVAIARALVMNPRYLFADEPTGSLDSANGDIVMGLFEKVNRESGTTIVLVTHDAGFANRARRQIKLVDGRIVDEVLEARSGKS
jgi:lipoprotein-releasing system ATP-binding protein